MAKRISIQIARIIRGLYFKYRHNDLKMEVNGLGYYHSSRTNRDPLQAKVEVSRDEKSVIIMLNTESPELLGSFFSLTEELVKAMHEEGFHDETVTFVGNFYSLKMIR